MDIHVLQWLAFMGVMLPAAMSPGPDFVIVVRNALAFSRRAGVFTALGLSVGVLVHLVYTFFGFAALIAKSVVAFNVIKWLGAGYLIFIGFSALRSGGMSQKAFDKTLQNEEQEAAKQAPKTMTPTKAFVSGFLTNMLNPKAALFFLAIVAQIVSPNTPIIWKVIDGFSAMVIIGLWFSFVAYALTGKRARALFLRYTKWIDRVTGGLLVLMGVKVALSKSS